MKLKYAALALLLAVLGIYAAGFHDSPPEPGPAATRLGLPLLPQGSFHPQGPARGLPWSGAHQDLAEADSASTDPLVGTLTTSPFIAPVFLRFYVSGYPNAPGMRIYLKNPANGQTLDLISEIDPGPMWRMRQWKIPRTWRGASVTLVVDDKGSGPSEWVGITEPHSGSLPIGSSIRRALQRTFLLVLLGLAFLLPGIAIMLVGQAIVVSGLSFARAMGLIFGGSSLTAYAVFWIYLANRQAGQSAAWIVLIASIVSLPILLWKTPLDRPLATFLFRCFATVFLIAIFNNSLGFLYIEDNDIGQFTQQRYVTRSMPPDNVLQELFAERLYDGKPLTVPLVEYWHTSDRPPIETAITLLEMPFGPKDSRDLRYQLLGVFLQCTWVAGMWTLLHSAGVPMRYIAFVIAFAVLTDFCLIHTFYVWPKLLSAAFCLLGFAFLPWRPKPPDESPAALDFALGGFMLGFAVLAHTGVAFTILPALAISYRVLFRRAAVWGLASLLLVQLPWTAYQKWIDPPGDSLLKQHLSGSVDLHQSLWHSVAAAYSQLTPAQYFWNKLANVAALFNGQYSAILFPTDWRSALEAFLTSSFFYLSFTLGLLALGLALRPYEWNRKGIPEWQLADRFVTVAAAALALWCFVLFEPGSTIVHQGSFATVLLLFAACVLYLAPAAPRLFRALLAIQLFALFPLFVFGKLFLIPAQSVLDNPLDPGMTLLSLAVAPALLVPVFRRKLF